MSGAPDLDAYGLKAAAAGEVAAPELSYRPPMPAAYRPRIALVGAGGISAAHLAAYRRVGFDVAVICNRTLSKAEARRDEYFPEAEATDDIARTLVRDDIAVVDLTPHPAERRPMIETALSAGKHVLSQKPFALDLDAGARLCDLADEKGVLLAVNQNGRWAPHLAWMREAVRRGLIGDVQSCNISIFWDHGWIAGTPFEAIDDLVLYDFAVHWFDFLASLHQPLRGWKIGYSRDFGMYPVDPEVLRVVDRAVRAFEEAGAHVEEVTPRMRHSQQELSDLWCRQIGLRNMLSLEEYKDLGYDIVRDHPEDLPPQVYHWGEIALAMSPMDMYRDQNMRTTVFDAVEEVLSQYRLLVTPTLACLPVDNRDPRRFPPA